MKSKKLTLFIPETVVQIAKDYAKLHGTSVSALVTRLFESIQAANLQADSSRKASGTMTAKSLGMVKTPKRGKGDLLSDALGEKYK